jgi:hypothetical protein
MGKGVEELVKLLMELREFYDSMINPFISVISLHTKGSGGGGETTLESREEVSLGGEVEKLSGLQDSGGLKKDLIKDSEEVGRPLQLESSSPIHICRCLSFLLGNRSREILNALSESYAIEEGTYKSLIGRLELMQNVRKAPEPLSLVLSTYLLTSNLDERSMTIVYSLLSRHMRRCGLGDERV